MYNIHVYIMYVRVKHGQYSCEYCVCQSWTWSISQDFCLYQSWTWSISQDYCSCQSQTWSIFMWILCMSESNMVNIHVNIVYVRVEHDQYSCEYCVCQSWTWSISQDHLLICGGHLLKCEVHFLNIGTYLSICDTYF